MVYFDPGNYSIKKLASAVHCCTDLLYKLRIHRKDYINADDKMQVDPDCKCPISELVNDLGLYSSSLCSQ